MDSFNHRFCKVSVKTAERTPIIYNFKFQIIVISNATKEVDKSSNAKRSKL